MKSLNPGKKLTFCMASIFAEGSEGLNVIEFDMEVSDATVQPRIHHQWKPDVLGLEKGFNRSVIELLMQSPQKVYLHSPGTSLESIVLKNSYHYGFGDTRRPDSLAKGSDD